MRKLLLLCAAGMLAFGAHAASAASVTVQLTADQKTLKGGKEDAYTTVITDDAVELTLGAKCVGGRAGFLGLGSREESCTFDGRGKLKKPDGTVGALSSRWSGKYAVSSDSGVADYSKLEVSYIPGGGRKGGKSGFSGVSIIMPENPPESARALADRLFQQAQSAAAAAQGNAEELDPSFDSLRPEGLVIPSALGLDAPVCVLTGDMVYTYSDDIWHGQLSAECGDAVYNMEVTFVWGVEDNSAGGPYSLYAELEDGKVIEGDLNMKTSNWVNVDLGDGETDPVPVSIAAEGTFSGEGVDPELLRALSTYLATSWRTFVGA